MLGDEALTPDSSRFWPADGYEPGGPQPSFDKQYVRDCCLSIGWDKHGARARAARRRRRRARARRYVEAFERLTEISFADYLSDPKVVLGEGDRADPSQGGHSRPAGRGGRRLAPHARLRGHRRARRPARRLELDDDDPAEARAELERMARELLANPLIESFDDRASRPT